MGLLDVLLRIVNLDCEESLILNRPDFKSAYVGAGDAAGSDGAGVVDDAFVIDNQPRSGIKKFEEAEHATEAEKSHSGAGRGSDE